GGRDVSRGLVPVGLFFRQPDPAIAFRFLLGLDADAESMERRCGQNWGVLKTSPVDLGPQGAERAIDGRNLVAMAILCLEAEDLARLLQGGYRHVAKRSLCRLEPPVDRRRAAKSLCFDVAGVVPVEELRDAQAHGGLLCRRRHPRIA